MNRKRVLGLVDFDDLLLYWRAAAADEHLGTQLSAEVDHICVDEYQDVNALQVDVLRALRRTDPRLTVVGDDSQAVYGFRGASPRHLLDIEAAFLLVTPLARLSSDLTGTCRLAVELRPNREDGLAGVIVEVREGDVVSCTSRLSGPVDAVATGSAQVWLRAITDGESSGLEFSGDRQLPALLVDAVHGALFRAQQLL